MSDQTLTDPVLGTLRRRDETEWFGVWVGRLALTPKHEVKLVFDQWVPDADDVPDQLRRAGEALAALLPREWEFRLAAAKELDRTDESWADAGDEEPDLADLARWLVMVRVEVFGDGSANLVYDGPPPFDGGDICVGVNSDGTVDDVHIFS